MVPQDRRKKILALLNERSYMTVEELAQQIYVSVPTIRRDLKSLAEEGIIKRVHGGASHVSRDSFEWPFELRNRVHLREKRIIGKLAASLLNEGDHIFIDSGNSCRFMAEELSPDLRITALSNCVPTLQALSRLPNATIECPCGQYVPSHLSIFGDDAAAFIRTRCANYYFASAVGLDLRAGVNLRTSLDISVKKAMRAQSDKMDLLMDHSKMGEANYYRVFDFSEIDILITDCPLPQELAERCQQEKVQVITPR